MAANEMASNESLVISGISGRFPDCEDIEIFSERLISGENFVTFDEQRWPKGTYGLPEGIAKIRDIDKFDADFFGVSEDEANVLDPMNRILMEETYGCICDAGINPESLRGSKTGFFFGSWIEEVEDGLKYDIERKENIFSYYATRIPFHLDFRGPVCYLNNACASSLTAFQIAVDSIRSGQCDRAVVVASNLTLNPKRSFWQNIMSTLAPDSVCKVWDEEADGYVKGEAGIAVLIQKCSEAKRIYAKILTIRTNSDGFKREGFTFPGWRTQKSLMLNAMRSANIDGNRFAFFEAHGTGTQAGDPIEVKAIAESVCRTRNTPLIIGSIKATVGHTEGASGLASLAKVIIAYQKGVMAPTLNHKKPNSKIPQLFDGSVVVCNKPISFNGGIVGINNFGIGGGNATLIIDSFDEKVLDQNSYLICDPIPRIVLICGRNEELVEQKLCKLENKRKVLTKEFLSLLNDISDISPESGMNSRGFLILDQQKTLLNKMVDKCLVEDNQRRPVWFVFTGLGSQWPAMAQSLIKIEIFSKSFNRSINYLESIGAEVEVLRKYLLESEIDEKCEKPRPLITSLVVFQIGFVDLLNELGVKPNGIIGHSVGEIVSAYADGCITSEDALRIAHCLHSSDRFEDQVCSLVGLMAAVGLSWSEAQDKCFGSISVACNNSPNMVTMTGSLDDMEKLIENLNKENIFARKVDNGMARLGQGLACHSPAMKSVEHLLTKGAKELNINPKQRTNKWLSSTYPEERWADQECQWPSGEYFVENLCQPVLFYDCLKKAPKNCLFIEIGPFGLLRNSIAKSFDKTHNILYKELLRKNNNSGNLSVLLSALGQLYISGQTVKIEKLYPKVEYPIPRGTDFISALIKWDHKKTRFVTKFPKYFSPNNSQTIQKYLISLSGDNQYLTDHNIDGRILFPGIGYLCLVWETMAKILGVSDFRQISVEFSDVNLYQATHLTSDETEFKCHYFKDSSKFEVEVNKIICAKGFVFALKNQNDVLVEQKQNNENEKKFLLANDFYKEVKVRGYNYGPNFQGITRISMDETEARVKWTGHLISFLDSILQTLILKDSKRFLKVPTRIDTMKIDPKLLFMDQLESGKSDFTVDLSLNSYEAKTNGFYIKGFCLAPIARKGDENGELVLEKYQFIAYEEINAIDESLAEKIDKYSKQCYEEIKRIEKQIQNPKISDQLTNITNDQMDENNNYFKDNNGTDGELMKYIYKLESKDNSLYLDKNLNNCLELDNDLIHSTLLSERFLRSQLDVIIENTDLNKNILILEINTSKQVLYPSVKKIIGRTAPKPVLNIEYTLCHPNKDVLSQSLLDLKSLKFKDFEINKSVIPYHSLSQQNVVIFRDPNISLTQTTQELDYDLLLRSIEFTLKIGGFLLIFIRDNVLPCEQTFSPFESFKLKKNLDNLLKIAEELNLRYICKKSDSFTCSSILFRKLDKTEKNEIEIRINNDCLEWLEPLKQAMTDQCLDRIWLTSSEELNGIIGLMKSLQKEENGFKIRSLFFDSKQIVSETALMSAKQTDLVQNVFREKVWGSYRHLTLPEVPKTRQTNFGQIRQLKFGDLSTFRWCESPTVLWPLTRTSPKQTLIDVYYSPLNFKDVMHATGRLSTSELSTHMALDDVVLGLEFVGRRRDTGRRVMGVKASCGLSTSIIGEEDFLWSVPKQWSMAEASTVPCVYATAYYALLIRGQLKYGETVLIHAGTGGVGQAAINICLGMSCKVFTTVGSNEKRVWIKKRFPQLSDSCIGSSRDTTFEMLVMRETNGKGVDVVLNSLTDHMFWASVRCLGESGRFCEIGKYQFVANEAMDLSVLFRNKTFHGIYLDALFAGFNNLMTKRVERQRRQMWQLLTDGIKSGAVKPLSYTVFTSNKIESAFRFMASGKHIGKVLIHFRTEEQNQVLIARPLTVAAIPQTFFNPLKSYIITGGLGGMGLELMYWMYERNARNFILTSRLGVKTGTQEFAINRLRQNDCKIIVSTDNANDIYGAKHIVYRAEQLGPIGGIFLLALVLVDDLVENQTIEKFKQVMTPKSTQALIFDELSRDLSHPIDYFVAFSSVSCGRGIAGQTNYAFANSILERICQKRRADGLHGLAIQWGFVGDVGIAADNIDKFERTLLTTGFLPQKIVSCWAQLNRLLQSEHSVCSSFIRYEGNDRESDSKVSVLDSVCNILGMKDMSGVNANQRLSDLGMDSLMTVEVKNLLERECNLSVSLKEVANITVEQLKNGFK